MICRERLFFLFFQLVYLLFGQTATLYNHINGYAGGFHSMSYIHTTFQNTFLPHLLLRRFKDVFPVSQGFEALLVGLVFRLVELGDLGGVEELCEHAVLEELLLAALHLHQELLTVLVLAVHVEHGTAVGLARAQVLGVQVGQLLDL